MEKELLIKFLNGTANSAERRQVTEWLEQDDAKENFDRFLREHWKNADSNSPDNTDYPLLLKKIHSKIFPKSKIRPIWPWGKYCKIAVSLLLLLASAFFIKQAVDYKEPEPVLSERIIEKSTGEGEKLQLTLPDDSKITLNANTTVSFSSLYGVKDRIVRLSGEAFFEIAKDSLRPFRVETDGIVTTALGTAFNVFARSGQVSVALTEGRVAVDGPQSKMELEPGQLARMDKSTAISGVMVKKFDVEKITGWKEGRLVFDKKPLKLILEDLERWYGVEMKIDPGLNVNRRVIGTFRNKNLSDVLTGLGFSMGFEFNINHKEVTIKKNRL
ncbi:FecR domain-containing protein [Cyclobacterium sp.]|uniref:FecR family protein n=1 Tax=Cyclobacterium sp. TaxID=1966343 RepID=UPI0019A30D1B|nr:FecR domain-containing protein [Cyclobacterium sp.]MBD3629460.1 FecR domain-containing protein [Cyclobacterium sp.]